MKICTKCRVEKSRLEFHVRRASKDGLCPMCKPCAIAHVKSYENKEEKKKYDAEYRSRNAARLKKVRAEYAKRNSKELTEKSRAWRLSNPERFKEHQRAHYKRNEAKFRMKLSAWVKANPAKVIANHARRRARLAFPAWADVAAIKKLYERARAERKHVDHIVPLRSRIVCGLHCEANLQLLTPEENFKKNNRYWPDMP